MSLRDRAVDLVNRALLPLGAELRARRGDVAWAEEAAFVTAYQRVAERTMMAPHRLYVLWQMARLAMARSRADSAEIGAWRGGASLLLAELNVAGTHYALDTFTGLPEADADRLPRGAFATPVDEARSFLARQANAVVVPGLFPESAGPLRERRFCFVHLDMDLYAGTRAGLEFFLPRLVPGGVIVVDDYRSRHEGVTRAVDEMCPAAQRLALSGQCVIFVP